MSLWKQVFLIFMLFGFFYAEAQTSSTPLNSTNVSTRKWLEYESNWFTSNLPNGTQLESSSKIYALLPISSLISVDVGAVINYSKSEGSTSDHFLLRLSHEFALGRATNLTLLSDSYIASQKEATSSSEIYIIYGQSWKNIWIDLGPYYIWDHELTNDNAFAQESVVAYEWNSQISIGLRSFGEYTKEESSTQLGGSLELSLTDALTGFAYLGQELDSKEWLSYLRLGGQI